MLPSPGCGRKSAHDAAAPIERQQERDQLECLARLLVGDSYKGRDREVEGGMKIGGDLKGFRSYLDFSPCAR